MGASPAAPAPPSLRRQLLLWLLLPQAVLWLAAIAIAYQVALRYANLAIDQALSQSTRALARQVKPLDYGLLIDFPKAAQAILEEDEADPLFYTVSSPPGKFLLGNRNLPPAPPVARIILGEPTFYDGLADGKRLRLAALYLPYGNAGSKGLLLVQVAKGVRLREQFARDILVDTVMPLSLLMLATSLLVAWGVRRGLLPLRALRRQVENRSPRDLAPIALAAAPQEVRALAEAVNGLLEQVERSVAGQRRFIADAAHQLRTPLAGLKSQCELALSEAGSDAQRARLQRVLASAERSVHLVGQLLSLARAEPGEGDELPREVVDLVPLARELTAELVPFALQRGVDLGFAGGPGRLSLQGNPVLLREMLANLVDNAVRYSPAGGTVTVRLARDEDWALLCVEDDGPGIPEAERERVFERFTRLASDGQGCGLGLPIVREIARRHGGSVRLRGAAPRGLVAEVRLPISSFGM